MSTGTTTQRPRRSGPRGPEGTTHRPGRRSQLRRRRRRRSLLRAVGVVLIAVGVGALVTLWLGRGLGLPIPERGGTAVSPPPVTALLVLHGAGGTGADHVALLSTAEGGPHTALFVPVGTVADVPGHGMDQVGSALEYGDDDLVVSTVTNMLGVVPDGVVSSDVRALGRFVDHIGGIEVDVPERFLSSGGERIIQVEAGRRTLDGPTVAAMLGAADDDRTELDGVARADRVMRGLFAALQEPDARRSFVEGVGRTFDSTLASAELERLLAGLSDAQVSDALDVVILPVRPLADPGSFRPDQDRAASLVAERFGHAVGPASVANAERLQILNGNGRPGIGQEVARRVLVGGFRVVLTENADRFDHEETLVVVHGDEPARVALAHELVRLIGVGRVEISGTPQSVADFTIVVGVDFLEVVDGSR